MSSRGFEPLPPPTSAAELRRALVAVELALTGVGPPVMPVPADRSYGRATGAEIADDPGDDREPVAAAVATSGSTGEQKLALLTAAALRASAAGTDERLGGPGHWLLALPTEHVAGFQVLVRSVLGGTPPRLMPTGRSFSPQAFAKAAAGLVGTRRYTALVPTQLRRLVGGPRSGLEALATFDAILVGGAPLDSSVRDDATAAGARIVTTYGMTETCGGCVYDGVALPGVRVRAPVGRTVRLGGSTVFVGYLGRPDLTDGALVYEDGARWHVTNDLGELDRDGRLTIVGRADELIITGGEKVAPSVVESVLAGLASVKDIAVVGILDAEWGERVVALVVPRDPYHPPTLEALRGFARTTLPAYALPREIRLVAEIPRLAVGKPDRSALRDMLSRKA